MEQAMKSEGITRRSSGGFTLVELLVVIVIVLSLTAATLPIVFPALENRRMREAARLVNTYLAGARTRAIKTGRPVGVVFERDPVLGQIATTLSIAEVPPAFTGLTNDSLMAIYVANVQLDGTVLLNGALLFPPKFLRVGDLLQANHQGRRYTITAPDNDGDGFIDPVQSPFNPSLFALQFQTTVERNTIYKKDPSYTTYLTRALPWVTLAPPGRPQEGTVNDIPVTPVPFQIFRQPGRTAAAAMELPESIVFDMAASGNQTLVETFAPAAMLDSNFAPGTPDPTNVIIMFAPDGSIDRIFHGEVDGAGNQLFVSHHVDSPILFLLGRREAIGAGGAAGFFSGLEIVSGAEPVTLENAVNESNMWLMINPQSGQVSLSKVAPVNEAIVTSLTDNNSNGLTGDEWFSEILHESRATALEAETLSGR